MKMSIRRIAFTFCLGAGMICAAPRRAPAQGGFPTPTPMPSCTPVPYNQCPSDVQDKAVTTGDEFTLTVTGALIGCNCACQVQQINPPSWRPFWDTQYLELLDDPNSFWNLPVYPSATLHFKALKAGTTTVTAGSNYCPAMTASGTVTIADSPRLKADFDGSGCTDIDDFLVLLDYWGSAPPGGGDALVIADFLALLDNWLTGAACGA